MLLQHHWEPFSILAGISFAHANEIRGLLLSRRQENSLIKNVVPTTYPMYSGSATEQEKEGAEIILLKP